MAAMISAAAASTKCSQLSKTSSACLPLSARDEVLDGIAFGRELDAQRLCDGRRNDIRRWPSGASSTNQTPSREPSSRSAATCREMRVLPTPPEPTSVTSRCCLEQRGDLGELASRDRRTTSAAPAGCWRGVERTQRRKVGEQIGREQLVHVFGLSEILSRCSPRSRRLHCARQLALDSSANPETSTWPPWPIASRRATRLTAGPK